MKLCPTQRTSQPQELAPHACTFLQEPFADCYCMNISSFNIPRMLAFCNGDYRSCPIFRRELATAVAPSAAGRDGASTTELSSAKE